MPKPSRDPARRIAAAPDRPAARRAARRAARPDRLGAGPAARRRRRHGAGHAPTRPRSGTGSAAGRRGGPRPRPRAARRRSARQSPRPRRGLRRRRRTASPARTPAGRVSTAARTARLRSPSTATSPSSGSRAIVWPCLTFRPPIVASRTASVTWSVWIGPRPASVIGPTFAAALSSGRGRAARRSPRRRCGSGTTATGRSAIAATWRAARMTFGLLGRSRTSRASSASIAASSSPVLGLAAWPPCTTAATPKSLKIAASPSPAATATTASGLRAPSSAPAANVVRPAPATTGPASSPGVPLARASRGGSPAARCPVPPVNSAARALADVARLAVEVLDADPAERPQAQAVADDHVRPLVVDVDLDRLGVAGDERPTRRSSRGGSGCASTSRSRPGPGWRRNIVS